jgi:hypothetical protein
VGQDGNWPNSGLIRAQLYWNSTEALLGLYSFSKADEEDK